MKRLYGVWEIVLFYLLQLATVLIGYFLFSKYNILGADVSIYRFFWYVSLVLLVLFLFREAVLQRRINEYEIKKLVKYENKWLFVRGVTIVMFFVLTWFTAAGDLGPIILFIGSILNHVLPRPSFDLIYLMNDGVICKARLIYYSEVEGVEADESGTVAIKLLHKGKEKKIKYIANRKAEALYNQLLAHL